MDIVFWIRSLLLPVREVFPIEAASTLGLLLFGLSWVQRRSIVALPQGRRRSTLGTIGIAGAAAVLAVGTAASYVSAANPITGWGGWWLRPAPLLAVALALVIFTVMLRREPLPAPGERAIAPRRHWWSFAPSPLLWTTGITAALLLLTATWQTAIGVPLPKDGDTYGVGPTVHGPPAYMELQHGFGYVWGAGWPNHALTLIALALSGAALVLVLSGDANRPVFARVTAAEVRQDRAATARIVTLIALGGALLTLGAVWAFIGFNGDRFVMLGEPDANGAADAMIGSRYQDFAGILHLGGYLVQGLGAALLMRLAVDTWRELRAGRRRATSLSGDPAATANVASQTVKPLRETGSRR